MRHPFLMALVLALLPVGIFHASAAVWTLPGIHKPEVSVVYAENGEVLQMLSERNEQTVSAAEIAGTFLQAIVAIEDRRFYQHHGIDPLGLLRAGWKDLIHRNIVEGGSTITQQTAKMLFLSNEQTIKRKFLDMVYALQMEQTYSKEEILAMYCNAAYFGHGAYGIETAAHTYFAKSAKDLTLPEAAVLAGLPQSPSLYDPYVNPDKAKKRQGEVLAAMQELKMIRAEEREQAWETELNYQMSPSLSGAAPWLMDEIRETLIEAYGRERIYQGGLQIYTTLDMQMQKAANQAVANHMKNYDEDMQAALVAIEPGTGYIRAMVGGRNYRLSAYNRAYARRQPGSTYKPFIYSCALEEGYTQADQIECVRRSYALEDGQVYTPGDYGATPYHNRLLTLREAVMRSDNVVAVYLHSLLTPQKTAPYVRAFGLEKTRPVLSAVLGAVEASPMEMAAGYSVFASGGIYAEPMMIVKVVDKAGNVLEENHPQIHRVIDENVAYVMTDLLKSVMISPGTGAHLQTTVGREAAAKTGTTDDFHDAWMAGYTPELSCAVWVGYDEEKDVNLTGSSIAGPIWAEFLRDGLAGWPQREFPVPDGVVFTNICMETGQTATESCPWTMQAAFLRGTEPQALCWEHASQWDWLYQEWLQREKRTEGEPEEMPEPALEDTEEKKEDGETVTNGEAKESPIEELQDALMEEWREWQDENGEEEEMEATGTEE